MIKIELNITDGDAEMKMNLENCAVEDLQAGVCNLELAKMNLLGQLAALTDFDKKSDKDDSEELTN